MKNKFNIEVKEYEKKDSSQGFKNALAGLLKLGNKSLEKLSCDDFKALYGGLTCKELKAMRKLEKGLAL